MLSELSMLIRRLASVLDLGLAGVLKRGDSLDGRRALLKYPPSPGLCDGVGLGSTEMADRIGKTLSAISGLS